MTNCLLVTLSAYKDTSNCSEHDEMVNFFTRGQINSDIIDMHILVLHLQKIAYIYTYMHTHILYVIVSSSMNNAQF